MGDNMIEYSDQARGAMALVLLFVSNIFITGIRDLVRGEQ